MVRVKIQIVKRMKDEKIDDQKKIIELQNGQIVHETEAKGLLEPGCFINPGVPRTPGACLTLNRTNLLNTIMNKISFWYRTDSLDPTFFFGPVDLLNIR